MDFSEWFRKHLQIGADGFAWSIEQVPSARLYIQPPSGLGEWSVARHAFHMLNYEQTLALIEAGFTNQLLLSHDAGWYDPSREDGRPPDGFRGYSALTSDFIPALLERGVSDEQIRQITVNNPANAFAF